MPLNASEDEDSENQSDDDGGSNRRSSFDDRSNSQSNSGDSNEDGYDSEENSHIINRENRPARTPSERRDRKPMYEQLKNMFLYHPVLNQIIESTMRKYGLKNSGNEFGCVDPEVFVILSKGFEMKYTDMIRQLINISRSQNALSFVNKKFMPRDVIEVHASNAHVVVKDHPFPAPPQSAFPFAPF